MCNSKFMELSGTLLSSVLHIMMFRTPFPRKERREKKGDKHRNPSRNQEEPANHDGTEPLSWGKKEEKRRETSTGTKEERRRETSTGTLAGTRRNQQIMMEQNPCPEEGKTKEEGRQAPEPKKREEGRQAPEPQPEPRRISKSWWNRTPFLRKERREKKGDKHPNQRREKKGDKHRNPSRNQEEPTNHDGTEPRSWGKKGEERKGREEGRQAPEPQPEPGGTSKSWWNRTSFLIKERREKKGDKHWNPSRNNRTPVLRKEKREKKGDKHRNQRREKKGDKHRNPSRNQEEPANHDGTEPLS